MKNLEQNNKECTAERINTVTVLSGRKADASCRRMTIEINTCQIMTKEKINYRKMTAQNGRSMVEMLGVLAVIGVLSIGGIAGYSYGMNRWRANETINDVTLRAMDIITQLTQGNIPTLDAWETTTSTGYPISLNTDEAPTNYYIKIKNIPYEVCDIISKTMPESVKILVDNENEECSTGKNEMYFEFSEFDSSQGFAPCPSGTSTEGLGGYAVLSMADGNKCYCDDTNKKWDNSVSACIEKDGTCTSFSDCYDGEYCQFSSNDCNTPPTKGTCQNLSICGEKGVYEQFWMSDNTSNCKTNWWTVQDICAAKKMTMVLLADIGCTDSKNNLCSSATLSDIRNAGLTHGFWTSDDYPANVCYAWGVSSHSTNLVATGPRNNPYNALCINK